MRVMSVTFTCDVIMAHYSRLLVSILLTYTLAGTLQQSSIGDY